MIYKTIMVSMFLTLATLISCDDSSSSKKQFVWDEDLVDLTGGNLYTWLRKAPFDPEFDKYAEHGKGKGVVLTNEKQVFPFMNRYNNVIEELRTDHLHETDPNIYQTRNILYRDSIWGDLFVAATLLYDDQEVFLRHSYVELGSPLFDGVGAVSSNYSASLYETAVFAKKQRYKTGLYWVGANFSRYLMGFYQQGQLVFQTIVPLLGNDTLATLDKIKEVNRDLGLGIPEWDDATVAQLQRVTEPKTFWKNPFTEIYGRRVYLKTKDTPFTRADRADKGDYYFSYRSGGAEVSLYTLIQKTDKDKEGFNKANRKMDNYHYRYNDIFYAEQVQNGNVNGTAKTYFKANQYLEIHYRYPEVDEDAKKQVHDVLRYVRTLND